MMFVSAFALNRASTGTFTLLQKNYFKKDLC